MAELRVKGTGTLKLFENDNTSSVTIASPASLGADRTVTLPDGDVTLVAGTMSTGLTGWSTDSGTNDSLVPASASAGIYLGVAAATAANLLDDYEESTFTPAINFGGSATGITYSQQTGVYTKIGNLCVASFVLILSDKGSQTGTATLAGFPFSVGTSNTAATNAYTDRITMTNGVLGLYLASGTTATLYNQVSGDNAVVTDSHFADNSFISGRLTYQV